MFQYRLIPLGIGKVSYLSTLRYLQTGLANSFKYSVVTQGPKFGKSYSFCMISYSFLRLGALDTISTTLKELFCCYYMFMLFCFKFKIKNG